MADSLQQLSPYSDLSISGLTTRGLMTSGMGVHNLSSRFRDCIALSPKITFLLVPARRAARRGRPLCAIEPDQQPLLLTTGENYYEHSSDVPRHCDVPLV